MVSGDVTCHLIDRYQTTRRHMPRNRTPDTHCYESVVSQPTSNENYALCNIWGVTPLFCLALFKPPKRKGKCIERKKTIF